MEEEAHLFADADIEILPPETSAVGCPLSICDCCGKTARNRRRLLRHLRRVLFRLIDLAWSRRSGLPSYIVAAF